jgi:hypothetical protein
VDKHSCLDGGGSPIATEDRGRRHTREPALFGAAARDEPGHIRGQRVQLVDQQIEHVVDRLDHRRIDKSASELTK